MSPGLATRGRLLLQVLVMLFLVKPGLRVGVGNPELVQVSAGCERVELSGWGTQGAGEMVPAQGLCVCSSVPDNRCGGSGGLVSEQPLFWKIKPPLQRFFPFPKSLLCLAGWRWPGCHLPMGQGSSHLPKPHVPPDLAVLGGPGPHFLRKLG